ncbi:UNVERIFIED_CONTAM: PiggyBac transposable element-derived protein 3 [Trichonephila clavipes]
MVFKPTVVLFRIGLANVLDNCTQLMMQNQYIFLTYHYPETCGNPDEPSCLILQSTDGALRIPFREKPSGKQNIDSNHHGMNHTIIKQTHCTQCHKNTPFQCQKCNVALHVKYSSDYHTE